MKKIFTFFAIALCAMTSANAQEKMIFENGGTYTDGQELTTASTKLTLGMDKKSAKWSVKVSSSNASLSDLAVLMMVENSETGEMEEKERVVYISGGNNPKDDTGSSYDKTPNVPTNGTYYVITPSKNGKIHAGIVLNAGKKFYVVKSNGENLAPNTEISLKGGDSEGNIFDVTINDDNTIDDKLTGAVEFDVVANESYYIFCTGSKLGFFGYTFTEGIGSGIQNVAAEKTADAPAYNLAGQKVNDSFKGIVVKNGKKVVVK